MQYQDVKGVIFDIQRFAVHDGPGIRTTVFVKGCPLRCRWCHNPESVSAAPQLLYTPALCTGCGACAEVCPQQAHVLRGDRHYLDRRQCTVCGECAGVCHTGALELAGVEIAAGGVLEEVSRDIPYYRRSDGGMTVSGGEPLLQGAFTGALLEGARARGIHTALDTSGMAPWSVLEAVLEHVDLVLYDLKHVDTEKHAALTGAPVDQILDNLQRLDRAAKPVWIRIPLIPAHNDDDEAFTAMGTYLAGLKSLRRVEILRYHRLAEAKYERLGQTYSLRGMEPPSPAEAASRAEILRSCGLSPVMVR